MLSGRFEPSVSCQRASTGPRWTRIELVALSGEIDYANAHELIEQLAEVVRRHPNVCVDLRNVTFLDARGVGACLAAQRQARLSGCELRFANPVGIVARVIEVLRLETVLLGDSFG